VLNLEPKLQQGCQQYGLAKESPIQITLGN